MTTPPLSTPWVPLWPLSTPAPATPFFVPIPVSSTLGRSNGGTFAVTGQQCYLPWAAIRAAGQKFQFRMFGDMSDSQNQICRMKIRAHFGNPGAALSAGFDVYVSPDFAAGGGGIPRDSGWVTYDNAGFDTSEIWRIRVETGSNGDSGDIVNSNINVLARLV